MKLSLFTAAIFGFVSCSWAIPIRIADIDSIIERGCEIDDLAIREWLDLETRTGPFAHTNERLRENAKGVVGEALQTSALEIAATPSHQIGTYLQKNGLHIDRQQPVNAEGDYRVAAQLDGKGITTIGQVVLNKDNPVSAKTVAATLKHSIDLGQELRVPNSKKAQRVADNHAKHIAKQQKNVQAHKDGMKNAAKGEFKKGKK